MLPRLARVILCALLCGPASWCAAADDKVLGRIAEEARKVQDLYAPVLTAGLGRDQSAITVPEYDTLARMARDGGLESLVYFNREGEVRWAEDPTALTMTFAQYQKHSEVPLAGEAEAVRAKEPVVQALKGGKLYEVAVPFLADGRVQGAIVAVCGRAGLGRLVKKAPDIAAKVPAGAPAPPPVRAARQRYLSGLIYRLAGDPDRALQEWKAASSLAPDDPDVAEVLRRAGYKPVPEDAKACAAAYDQRRYDQAFIACRACLKRDPSNRTCAAVMRLAEGRLREE